MMYLCVFICMCVLSIREGKPNEYTNPCLAEYFSPDIGILQHQVKEHRVRDFLSSSGAKRTAFPSQSLGEAIFLLSVFSKILLHYTTYFGVSNIRVYT